MHPADQGFSSFRRLTVAAFCCLPALLLPVGATRADDLRKNIVVLVDASKSVDPANRNSALQLAAGLVTGKVDDASRRTWEFKPAPAATYPQAAANLQRIMQPDAEPAMPLAQDPARFVIAPLGNYARVTLLREQLAKPGQGSPDDVARHLLNPAPPFASSDNSTHISLAEAVVAQAFLKPASQLPYYLIVISDFYEDCLNRPVKDYVEKSAQVKADNAKVLRGEIPFNDGAGGANHKYSAADVEGIRYLNEKISDLLLGEFIYKGVPLPETPVNVRIYAPMAKRGLKVTNATVNWVLPDPPPGIALTTEGLDANAPLEVNIVNQDTHSEHTLTETCALILAGNRLEVATLLERPEIKPFLVPGNHEITLTVPQAGGSNASARCSLQIARPAITVGGDGLNHSTEAQPFVLPVNRVVAAEKVAVKLDPAPAMPHGITIQCGNKQATVNTNHGTGEFVLGDLLTGTEQDEPIKLTASLKLDPTPQTATKDVWLRLPVVSLWAVYDGEIVDGTTITLTKARSLTLKASHVGMEGLDWRGTTVTNSADAQQAPISLGDGHNLDFSDLKPGTYTVTANFGSNAHPVQRVFTVIVPAKLPWMLIAICVMVILSLALFGWHFLRR